MKRCFACACVLLAVGCSSDKDPNTGLGMGGVTGSAGSAPAQGGAGSANVAGGGSGSANVAGGGASAMAGAGTGGAGAGPSTGGSGGLASGGGGNSGGSSGSVGTAGSAGGGTAGSNGAAFTCPSGTFTFTAPTGKAAKVAGAPPNDSFNMNNWTNVEGPVWIKDSLYFSEMTGTDLPPARILKLTGGTVTVVSADSGSNGLAVDGSGNLLAAVHKDGSLSQIALPGGAATPIVSTYEGKRFTSPNDLAIRSDGTIYFSDPKYQNNANPQMGERVYRITPPPTRTLSVVAGTPSTPNGVTLSPDEKTLYVSGSGLKKFAVMTDGTVGSGSDFVAGSGGDGMAVDCLGNVYVTGNNTAVVRVYSPAGSLLTTIMTDNGGNTTNVAFGGADHKTLYITAQGTEGQRGVFSIALSVPGFPY